MTNREPHFCSHCNRTTFWEARGQKIVCIGDQRIKIRGCETECNMEKVKRYVGACGKCKRIRRGHKNEDGSFACLYCWGPLEDVDEVAFGDLSGI